MPGGFSFSSDGSGGGGGGGGGSHRRRNHHRHHHSLLHQSSSGSCSGTSQPPQPQPQPQPLQHQQGPTFVWDLLPTSRQPAMAENSTADAASASRQQRQQPAAQQQQPRLMTPAESSRMRDLYQRKVKDGQDKYELVASFALSHGRIVAYYPHRTRLPFQLTDRRRRLLAQYYSQGEQWVVLYVNQSDFEHYMPLNSRRSGVKAAADSSGGKNDGGGAEIRASRSANGLRSLLGIR